MRRAISVQAIGRFLVGALAQAIRSDLELQRVLLSPGLDGQEELRRDIAKICGDEGGEITPYFRTHTHDPWIGEALGLRYWFFQIRISIPACRHLS